MTHLVGIPSDEIDDFWPLIEELVLKPLVRTKTLTDFTPDDIRGLCKNREMQCWIAHGDGQVVAAGITQIIVTPRRKILGIPFVGAVDNTIEHWLSHYDTLKEFAKAHGCSAIRGWGRKGWERKLKVRPDAVRIEFDVELDNESIH